MLEERLAAPFGGRGGRGGGGGRGAGPGRGSANDAITDPAFHRLFDGITLTPDNDSSARAIILRAQTEITPLIPPLPPPRLQFRPVLGLVVMQPDDESALLAILTNDADRATVQTRITNPPPTDGAPRQP